MISIRKYQHGDELALRNIFFNTIRQVNIRDYSECQVRAWAPDDYDENAWSRRMRSNKPFIALIEDQIVGFSDVQEDGYIDHFFCHNEHQGKGVGKALMQTLVETGLNKGITRFYSHVSITAKPFFEHFGFVVVKKQRVDILGQVLNNYVMEKHCELS